MAIPDPRAVNALGSATVEQFRESAHRLYERERGEARRLPPTRCVHEAVRRECRQWRRARSEPMREDREERERRSDAAATRVK